MTSPIKRYPMISSISQLTVLSRQLALLLLLSYYAFAVSAFALQQDGQALQEVQTEIKQRQQTLAKQKQLRDSLQERLKADEQAISKIAAARHKSSKRQQQLNQQKEQLEKQITAINQSIASQKRALTEVVKAAGLKANTPATKQGRVFRQVITQSDLGLDGIEFFATVRYSRAHCTCRQVDKGRVPGCAAQRRAVQSTAALKKRTAVVDVG